MYIFEWSIGWQVYCLSVYNLAGLTFSGEGRSDFGRFFADKQMQSARHDRQFAILGPPRDPSSQ